MGAKLDLVVVNRVDRSRPRTSHTERVMLSIGRGLRRGFVSGTKEPLNADSWAAFMSAFPVAFPDAQISVDASVAERDIVASRWTLTGTHRGEFQGVPPTGTAVTMVGIDFTRVVGGKITQHWAQFDVIGVMQQIGAIPAPA